MSSTILTVEALLSANKPINEAIANLMRLAFTDGWGVVQQGFSVNTKIAEDALNKRVASLEQQLRESQERNYELKKNLDQWIPLCEQRLERAVSAEHRLRDAMKDGDRLEKLASVNHVAIRCVAREAGGYTIEVENRQFSITAEAKTKISALQAALDDLP